jgi:hypothetical protein
MNRWIALILVVGGLSGCALYRRLWTTAVKKHGHCEPLCNRFSGIPGPTTSFAVDAQTCRCELWPTEMERKVYGPNQAWSVDIHCKPDCKTFAEKVLKYSEEEMIKHP